jgi:hypothetical protein
VCGLALYFALVLYLFRLAFVMSLLIEPGTFICFQGTLGSGKTLNMSRIGAMAAARGQKIYANYDCVFAERLESITHMFQVRNAVLLLDELQSILDSRDFKNNSAITQWVLIVRKLGLSVLYTTQFLGQVDLRVRHVTEWVYGCEKKTLRGGQRVTKVSLIKWRGEGGTFLRSFNIAHTPELFALYNTYDYEVKLTKDSRKSSFNPDDIK